MIAIELSDAESKLVRTIRRERAKKKPCMIIVRLPRNAPIQLFSTQIIRTEPR